MQARWTRPIGGLALDASHRLQELCQGRPGPRRATTTAIGTASQDAPFQNLEAPADSLAPLLAALGIGADAQQWRSPVDPGRRFCATATRFVKIQCPAEGCRPERRSDLRGEFALLQRTRGVRGVPAAHRLIEGGRFQLLIMERVDGVPLHLLRLSWPRLALTLARLLAIVWRLARVGVSHDDLRPENVLVAAAGEVVLIDFDQAIRAPMAIALGRALLGLGLGLGPVPNTLFAPLRERLQALLPPRLVRRINYLRTGRRRPTDDPLPPLPATASPALRALHGAWRIAARSRASAPGRAIAYHDLVHEGFRLPGERPWAERWRCLSAITDYRGRRVLELGCNMGLLSTFLLQEGAARAVLGVDCDPAILRAASQVAKAYGVRPEFQEVDFDRDVAWEAGLAAFTPDVVFALSVFQWVQDKPRFLAFLARFDEVVYEGHDSIETERARLGQAGFARIDLVAVSERARPVLHCRR